jgi:YD repeat-containing protein
VIVEATRDPFVPEDYHWCRSDVRFRLSRAARVTLRASGREVDGYVDGGELVTVSDVALGAGAHRVSLVGGELADVASIAPYALDARDAGGHVEATAGILEGDLANPPVLVVGRTFVRGVDLLDGHVVNQATDYETGKGPIGLRVTRTYTSAGRGAAGLVGAGWSFSWQLTLTRHADLFLVRLSDGNGLVFRRRKDGTFEPPSGYHLRLVSNPDGSLDFYDLAGYRYRFERPLDPREPLGKLRLEVIVSPEAGRALLRYDASGRLARVSEETPEGREVWHLDFGYTRAGGFERLAWARDRNGRVSVRYAYDSFGNLVGVTRRGPKGEAVLFRRDHIQALEAWRADRQANAGRNQSNVGCGAVSLLEESLRSLA